MSLNLLVNCGSKLRMKEIEEVKEIIRSREQIAHKRKKRNRKIKVHTHFNIFSIFISFLQQVCFDHCNYFLECNRRQKVYFIFFLHFFIFIALQQHVCFDHCESFLGQIIKVQVHFIFFSFIQRFKIPHRLKATSRDQMREV